MQGLMGKRKFTFVNYGGSYQLRIERAEDLVHLDDLDDPFWMATSAPIDQLRCDRVALEHLDVNRNGRIISGELRRTRRWLFAVLRDLQGVTEGRDLLRLEDVDEAHEDGAKLLAAAHRILANLDRPGSPTISLAEIRDTKSILAKGAVNGDGIIPPRAVSEPELRSLLQDGARTVGTVEGVDGGRGVDAARLDRFVAEAEALLAWRSKATEHETRDLLLPLGEETPAGHELLERLRGPIERYFKLCALLQLNESLGRRTAEPTSPATAPHGGRNRAWPPAQVDGALARPRADLGAPSTQDEPRRSPSAAPRHRPLAAILKRHVSSYNRPASGGSTARRHARRTCPVRHILGAPSTQQRVRGSPTKMQPARFNGVAAGHTGPSPRTAGLLLALAVPFRRRSTPRSGPRLRPAP